MTVIRSRDNPRVKRWAKLASDSAFRRKEGRVLIEGPHLVAEALQAGIESITLIVSETGLKKNDVQDLLGRHEPFVLGDHIFGIVADAETPPGIAAEIAIPRPRDAGSKPAVFLEGVQDPANVGAILRSAAAFGSGEVVLDHACADPWSPKVLRAAMGGHFSLRIGGSRNPVSDVERFTGHVACAVPHGGVPVANADLKGPVLWIFGSEAQGVRGDLVSRADLRVTIPMRGPVESLNVGAAAAICFYEASRLGK
jgi:RNA methyltransferase, TrmH family